MADIAMLGIGVDSRPVVQGKKDLDDFSTSGAKAEKSTGGFRAAMEKLLGSLTRIERVLASSEKHLSVIASSSTAAQKAVDALGAANQNAAKKVDELAVANTGAAAAIDKAETAATTAAIAVEKTENATTGAGKAAQEFGGKAEAAGKKAEAANDSAARSAEKVSTSYGKWEAMATRVSRAVGLIAGALATNALFGYADAWSDMQSRVGAAIKDMDAAPAMMQRIVDIANASYSPLSQTVEIYGRNVAVLSALGRTATEAADFTEALNHALVTTATKGQDADVVLNALSRSIAIGGLRSMEFETIMSRSPRVLEAIASELGTNITQLRALAQQGKVTGDVIVNALINNLEALRAEAGEMPATIGDAFTRLTTNLTAFIGQMDQATGASQRISDAIMLLANNIDVIARVAAVAGVALLTAFAPALLASMASGFVALGTAGVAAISAITAAIAANPIGAIAVALTTAVTAAYLFRDEIKQAIGVDVIGIVKTAANYIIGSFVAAYEDIKFVWGNFGNIMGAAVIGGVNIAIKALNSLAASAKVVMNDLIGAMNMIPGVNIGTFDVSSDAIGQIENPYAKRLEGAVSERNAAIQSALSRDYIGELGEIVFGTKSATEATDAMTSAIKAANDNLSQTEGAAGKAAKGIKDVKQEADKAAESALKFGADLVKGFVSDLRSGLEQGKGFWKSFGDAAMNVLDKIVDKLLNNVIDALFQVNSVGSRGGGGGGFLGGILGGIGRLFGFASGGYTGPGAASQPAGIVHAGEYVMSKSAVDRLGVGYLDALHNAAKGYQMGGYVRSHAPANINMRGYQPGGYVRDAAPMPAPQVNVEQHFHIDGAVSSKDVQQMVRAGATEAVDTVKRSLSGWQHQIARDGAVA